jgi:hypothetical protein
LCCKALIQCVRAVLCCAGLGCVCIVLLCCVVLCRIVSYCFVLCRVMLIFLRGGRGVVSCLWKTWRRYADNYRDVVFRERARGQCLVSFVSFPLSSQCLVLSVFRFTVFGAVSFPCSQYWCCRFPLHNFGCCQLLAFTACC